MPAAPNRQILLQSVEIGPKTAKNLFYQVHYCNGMGRRWPRAMAVHAGRHDAREREAPVDPGMPFRRESHFEAGKTRPAFGA